MSIQRLGFWALLITACGDEVTRENPPQITDQSGAVFGWDCDDERCHVTLIDGSPPLPDCGPKSKAVYGYTWGSLITIAAGCTFDEGWGWLPGWDKLVVCEEDEDCPTIPGKGGDTVYVCNAGFCRNVDDADYFDELPPRWAMEMICRGDELRFESDGPSPALTAALELACPGDSSNAECLMLPAGCRDPRG